jgi:hypothetical protein
MIGCDKVFNTQEMTPTPQHIWQTYEIFVGRTVGLPNVLRGWCHFLGVEDFVAADHTFPVKQQLEKYDRLRQSLQHPGNDTNPSTHLADLRSGPNEVKWSQERK